MITVNIDLVGLLATIFLIGVRYPHHVLLAALVNFLGFFLAAFILAGNIESITLSGIFSSALSPEMNLISQTALIVSPAFVNYAAGCWSGPNIFFNYQSLKKFLSPVALLDSPFSIINLRFAVFSLLYNLNSIFLL